MLRILKLVLLINLHFSWGILDTDLMINLLRVTTNLNSIAFWSEDRLESIRVARGTWKHDRYFQDFEPNNHNVKAEIVIKVKNESSLTKAMKVIHDQDLGVKKPVLLFMSSHIKFSSNIRIRINQQVYFISLDTKTIMEMYSIGNKVINNTIGRYVKEGTEFKLNMDQDLSLDIGSRRNNLHGQSLNVFVANEPPYSYLSSARVQDPQLFNPEVGLYDMTTKPPIGGHYVSLFKELHRRLNFTFRLFALHDQIMSYGTVIDNKTIGIMRHFENGTIDLLAGATSMTLPRSTVVEYLPIVGGKFPSIFIRNAMGQEFNWLTFLRPFSNQLWLVIIFVAVAIGTLFYIANDYSPSHKVL